ncbi:hypothetical protein F2Q68_00033902 [Brassica cretica]|uniref:Uncharacterized protein n=1 Tax=Brassica cretica TaxID=69181 RepID=A0A8S9H254_BRACR|nr:hypothetical protein F2Q68_00033902 [Brassica cretica]
MLYLKAGRREVLEDLVVKVILWLRTILFWEGSQRIYSIVILHKFYFRMYWACFYSGWRLGNIFRLQDYCGSHEDADDDHLRMIIWVDYGYKINWLDFLWFNRVESQALETNSGGDVRRHNQQVSGKQDVKGKGIAYEGGKQAAGAKLGPGRRHRDQGRSMTRYVRQAGYLPP